MFVRFLMVGVVTTAIHYLLLVSLVHLLSVDPVLASSVGFIFSAFFNYFLNRSFAFGSTREHREAGPRFIVVALFGLAINAILLLFATVVAGCHYMFGQIFATLGALFWNFLVNKFWTFRSHSYVRSQKIN